MSHKINSRGLVELVNMLVVPLSRINQLIYLFRRDHKYTTISRHHPPNVNNKMSNYLPSKRTDNSARFDHFVFLSRRVLGINE